MRRETSLVDDPAVVDLGTLSNDTTVTNTDKGRGSQGPGAWFHVRDSNEHRNDARNGAGSGVGIVTELWGDEDLRRWV